MIELMGGLILDGEEGEYRVGLTNVSYARRIVNEYQGNAEYAGRMRNTAFECSLRK